MASELYEYGMIGLGTMGRNLVYNMSDHGFSVAGYDKDLSKVDSLEQESAEREVHGARTIQDFIASLKTPRVILMLVPAGKIVDFVIAELQPLLSKDDLLVDCGNSHFTDTDRRIAQLATSNLHFMGVGISGGESGARRGPSIMPGGDKEVYKRIGPMLEAISAKVNNQPCVAYLGSGSAGHYVKMVHNGIEYGIMQLIAETYHLLKVCGGLSNDELHALFTKWNSGALQSFLVEITAEVFARKDKLTTGNYLVDMILDSADQKGTGMWTSQDAMSQHIPITVIDSAVSMRDLSSFKKDRVLAEKKLEGPKTSSFPEKETLKKQAEDALHFAMLITYAQGMSLLHQASETYHYDLQLEEVAKIWRGGCIIRAAVLEAIRVAYSKEPKLKNLIASDIFSEQLNHLQEGTRATLETGIRNGISLELVSLPFFGL